VSLGVFAVNLPPEVCWQIPDLGRGRSTVDVLPKPALLVHFGTLVVDFAISLIRLHRRVHKGARLWLPLTLLLDAGQGDVQRQDSIQVVLVEQMTLDLILKQESREVVLSLITAKYVS